jgi:hypothetical protein
MLYLRSLVHLYLGPNLYLGTIPSAIQQLSHVVHLYINNCTLHGTIPSEIEHLTKLRT